MTDISNTESEEFEALLGWLSEDREQAGAEYNKIRAGLIRFFRFKGCSDPVSLADETLNRVAKRITSFDESNNAKKSTIIYGFAKNIFLEDRRNRTKIEKKLKDFEFYQTSFDELKELRFECMEECLVMVSKEDREQFIEFYAQENAQNSDARRQIAERFGLEMNALYVRIFRMRAKLAKCIEKCVKKNL